MDFSSHFPVEKTSDFPGDFRQVAAGLCLGPFDLQLSHSRGDAHPDVPWASLCLGESSPAMAELFR